MAEETTVVSVEVTQPIIIDLGKQKPGLLSELKKGEGKLWDEVLEVTEEVKEMLGAEVEGKVLVPMIIIYQEKTKQQRLDLNKVIFPLLDEEEEDDDDEEDDKE